MTPACCGNYVMGEVIRRYDVLPIEREQSNVLPDPVSGWFLWMPDMKDAGKTCDIKDARAHASPDTANVGRDDV